MDPRHGRCSHGGRAAGFTLIELLVVIAIIGIVVVIVFPALAGARNAARRAATQAMMSDIGKASEQFTIDNRRAPGYYPSKIMGLRENMDTEGFTSMENIMLELAGGIVPLSVSSSEPGVVEVGPSSTPANSPDAKARVKVDIRLIGAKKDNRAQYWSPDSKYYISRNGNGQVGAADNLELPDVVDAWGTPILAWVQDDIVAGGDTFFALEAIQNGDSDRARYYWAANAGHLKSPALGKLAKPQSPPGAFDANAEQSLLGERYNWANARSKTMAGLLGNPAYPEQAAPDTPSRGRAGIVFHSAGNDGIFLNRKDVAGKRAAGNPAPYTNAVRYNPPTPAATPGTPAKPVDPLDGFDDLIVTTGN